MPPTMSSPSRTTTRVPSCASRYAAVRPPGPAPMTATVSPAWSGAVGWAFDSLLKSLQSRLRLLVVASLPAARGRVRPGRGFPAAAPQRRRERLDPARRGRTAVLQDPHDV